MGLVAGPPSRVHAVSMDTIMDLQFLSVILWHNLMSPSCFHGCPRNSVTKSQKLSVFACLLATKLATKSKQETGLLLSEPMVGHPTTFFGPDALRPSVIKSLLEFRWEPPGSFAV